jgi:hypothetical protein
MNEELKKLLDHSVEYATELLTETGECYPFGAYIDTVGNVHPLELEIDPKNVPQIGKVVDSLDKYCKAEMTENRMRGYCLSYEVKVQLSESKSTDAICFDLVHTEEKDIPKFYLPFLPLGERKTEVGDLFAVK